MIAPALALALALDVALGEPPARFHPVVAMGRYLAWARLRFAGRGRLAGALVLLAGIALAAGSAWLLARLLRPLPAPVEALALALLLKPLLSLRALLTAAEEVRRHLLAGALVEARKSLGRHLVSRETGELTAPEVAGATVSSLAENLTDSLVAPILYFALFGLPGAAVYRFCNTADAVLGYRTPELARFGAPAARVDDLLNLVPARLAALLLLGALALSRRDARGAARSTVRDARSTPSPNGGWTMACVAGGLRVRLEKRGAYLLNGGGREPLPGDIRAAQQLVALAVLLLLLGLAALRA
jgi:adenosylcobinamide-phosphate synthase